MRRRGEIICETKPVGPWGYIVWRSAYAEIFNGRLVPYIVDHFLRMIVVSSLIADEDLPDVIAQATEQAIAEYPGYFDHRELPDGYGNISGQTVALTPLYPAEELDQLRSLMLDHCPPLQC